MIQKYKLSDMTNGWFVGKFKPTALDKNFEVCYREHKKGEIIKPHYHRYGTEVTLVVSGKEKINGVLYAAGDIFVIEPYTVAEIEILEDLKVVVVKDVSGVFDKVDV